MTRSPTRILLVEDDPTSREVLARALRELPADVDAVGSVAGALGLMSDGAYDLWMIDARLPDGTGAGLLRILREQGRDGIAMAHTASSDPGDIAALRAAGFSDVVGKPIAAAALRAAVEAALVGEPGPPALDGTDDGTHDRHAEAPLWDDRAALLAMHGNPEHVAQLRALFLGDLPDVCEALARAVQSGDTVAIDESLHRLRASCGFVGASRLGLLVDAWRPGAPAMEWLRRFQLAARETLGQPPAPLAP